MNFVYIFWALLGSCFFIRAEKYYKIVSFLATIFFFGPCSVIALLFWKIRNRTIANLVSILIISASSSIFEGYSQFFFTSPPILLAFLLPYLMSPRGTNSFLDWFQFEKVFGISELVSKIKSWKYLPVVLGTFLIDWYLFDISHINNSHINSLNFLQSLFVISWFALSFLLKLSPVFTYSTPSISGVTQAYKRTWLVISKYPKSKLWYGILMIFTLGISTDKPISAFLVCLTILVASIKWNRLSWGLLIITLGSSLKSNLPEKVFVSWVNSSSNLFYYYNEFYIFHSLERSFFLSLIMGVVWVLILRKKGVTTQIVCFSIIVILNAIQPWAKHQEYSHKPSSISPVAEQLGKNVKAFENSINETASSLLKHTGQTVHNAKVFLYSFNEEKRVSIKTHSPLTRITKFYGSSETELKEIDLAGNEWESFQFVGTPSKEGLKGIRLKIIEKPKSLEELELYVADFVYCEKGNYPTLGEGWYADPLIPMEKKGEWYTRCDLPKISSKNQANHPIWINLKSKAISDNHSEILKVEIEFLFDDIIEKHQQEVTLNFFATNLPQKKKFKTLFGWNPHMWWSRWKGTEKENFNQKDEYKFFHNFGINPTNIYSKQSYPPIKDWKYCDSLGFNKFCYGSIEAKLNRTGNQLIIDQIDSISNLDFRADFSIYGFDERPEGLFARIDSVCHVFKQFNSYHELLSTCFFGKKTADLGIKFCLLPNVEDKFMENIGSKHWWYVCENPLPPASNFLIDQPLLDNRKLFWEAHENNIEGLLYWSVSNWTSNHLIHYLENSPFINPSEVFINEVKKGKRWPELEWISKSFRDKNGDGHLVYPGLNNKLWPSIRLINIRDGIEDTEILSKNSAIIKIPSSNSELLNIRKSVLENLSSK